MPTVFLSPSTQEFNPYVIGGDEEYYTNLIVDAMIPYLEASGINYSRNDRTANAAAAIAKSNAGNYDLHFALHSNASPEQFAGQLQGPDIYYYPGSVNGRRAAMIIADNLRDIYPQPQLVDVRTSTQLGELSRTRAPSVFVELAYHDNIEDAEWIRDNINQIAENLAFSLTEYFDLPFVTPY